MIVRSAIVRSAGPFGLTCCFLIAVVASTSLAGSGRWEEWSTGPSGARTLVELPAGQIIGVRTVRRNGAVVIVTTSSADGGRTWADGGAIAEDAAGTDLGDCHLLRLRSG